ncbi:MAG: putative Ig domain-containing protein [Bacteroidales bacterium]|nr:putative Ig domain-containing protein [Bacteroidales bacterium]
MRKLLLSLFGARISKLSAVLLGLLLLSGVAVGQPWSENFDDQTSGSYLTSFNCSISGTWTALQAGNFGLGTDRSAPSCVAINDDITGAHITTPDLNTCGTVSFYYYARSGSASDQFELQVSENGGAFVTVDTYVYGGTTAPPYALYSFDVNSSASQVNIRVLNDHQDSHLIIDDFSVTTYSAVTNYPDWCNLQSPASGSINTGGAFNVYAQVFESGLTEAAGQGAGISCWIGYSTTNDDPSGWTNWVAATYNTDVGNNDEYMADIGSVISSPGTYYYASRFTVDGTNYSYGGYVGGFWDGSTNVNGTLTISANYPNWCNLQWPTSSSISVGTSYDVYARVYEPGVTDAVGQGANVSAWIGYSTTDSDPSTWTNWVVATYNADTDGNANDEYTAEIGAALPAGTYYYASRFKVNPNADEYSYGGYSAGGGGFWDGSTYDSQILTITGPPTITTSETTLTGFTYDEGSGPSTNQTFTISGSDLVGSGNITVTGTTNYEVSTDGSSYSGSVTYPYASGEITGQPQTVYVRLKSGLTAGDYNSENIQVSGGSATSENVTCSGTVTTPSSACATDLIISEYCEGSSNNKYIEIYNGTGSLVTMTSVYRIGLISNGGSWTESTISLSGTVADDDVFIIANSAANGTILAASDQTSGTSFNGDDAVALQKFNGTSWDIIDVIGTDGADPGTAWDVAGVTNGTAEHTLIRKSTITDGQTNWTISAGTDADDSEWIVNAQDDFTDLGSHTMTCCTPPSNPTATGDDRCGTGTLTLSASGAGSGEVYKWYDAASGGTLLKTSSDDSDDTYTTASISTTTSYYVSTFITATSCESNNRTEAIATVNTIPDMSLTNVNVCSGATTGNLAYSGATGSPDEYSIDWDATAEGQGFSDVASTSLPVSPISLTIPGGAAAATYNGTLYLENTTTTCTNIGIAFTVTVNASSTPTISIAITSGANPSCSGESVEFTATANNLGGGTASYQWKNDGGNVGSNNAVYSTSGLTDGDDITCDLTVSGGCVTSSTANSNTIAMTINPIPATPTAGSNSPICSGSDLDLTSNASGTIAWTGPDSFTSSFEDPTISSAATAATGTYSVTSTVSGCTSLPGTTDVTVNATPAITSSLTASGTTGNAFSYFITGSYSPTSYNATGLPAGLSINTSTGEISGTPPATGVTNVTISATNACGTGNETLVITISTFTYVAGDYRSTADYVEFSWNNPAGTTDYWEYYDGSSWGPTPSDNAPENAATTPARIIIDHIGINAGGNTTNTYNDIIIRNGGQLILTDDDSSPTSEFINANKTIEVQNGGELLIQGDMDMPSDGALIVRDGGLLTIDQASMQNVHPFWDGVENFEAGSEVKIVNWNFGGTPTNVGLYNISNSIGSNSEGYKFGYLTIDANTNSDWAWCGGSYSVIVDLVYNDAVVSNAGTGYIGGITNKTGTLGYVINGDLIINDGNFNFSATYSSDPFEHQAFVNGDFEFNSTGTLHMHRNANLTADAMTKGTGSFVEFGGNITVNSAATFTNDAATDNTRMYMVINGSGTESVPQLLDIGATTGMTGIDTYINNNTFVQLSSNNWIFNGISGLTTGITLETGSSLHFGWADDNTTPLIITMPGGAVGTNQITTETGTTLYMTHSQGLDDGTNLTNGNVQQFTQANRSFDQTANFWYVGKANQVTGNGITTASTNKVIGLNMGSSTNETTLSDDITTSGKLILMNGVLKTTSSELFTLEDNATVHTDATGSNGEPGSANSWVDGPLKKIGNDAFVFPLGENIWAPIGISAPSNATDAFIGEYFNSAYSDITNMDVTIDEVSDQDYWDITSVVGSSIPTVTAYWKDNRYGIADFADVVVAHYIGGSWRDQGNTNSSGTVANGSIDNSVAFSSFSPITLGFKNTPTPVELLSFDAVRNNSIVDIEWKTASEQNNDYFTIEKSIDAQNFIFVDNVKGNGNSNKEIKYSTIDFNPYSTKSYYRLKQTDFDGKFTYSNIVEVKGLYDLADNNITISKKPSAIHINIADISYPNDCSIIIFDMLGRVLYKQNYQSFSNDIFINNIDFQKGIYNVTVIYGENIKTEKIVW